MSKAISLYEDWHASERIVECILKKIRNKLGEFRMPRVSIVLPTYNGEKYIKQSVDSIIKQSFKDWELIIVNDCSKDATPNIIEYYARKEQRIKVINNKTNQKLPTSLNIGFAEAGGEYLTWTSDDNVYFPNAIEYMVTTLDQNSEYEMVCADMRCINEEGTILKNEVLHYDDTMQCFNNLVGACFMYRRGVMERVGEYNTDLIFVEDYDYWMRVKKYYKKIHRISCVLYSYRSHPKSLTETKQKEIQKQLMRMRKNHIDLILSELCDKKEYICKIYYEFINCSFKVNDIEKKFFKIMPELKNEKITMFENKKYMIFGAGEIGEEAYKILKDKACLFVDNNKEKIGTMKCGLPIISYQKMFEYLEIYNIMIAVSNDFIYEIIEKLYKKNIVNYCTYQYYIMNYFKF